MQPNEAPDDQAPPVGRTWARLYAIVIGALAVEILIFYAFTRALQ